MEKGIFFSPISMEKGTFFSKLHGKLILKVGGHPVYSLAKHAKLSKKQIRVGKSKTNIFFYQKCLWGNCYNSRKKIINFSKNCQKKLNLLTLEQKQGPNYDNFQRTWYLWGFMKKLGSIENFFQNLWPFIVTWGVKSKMC